MELKHEFAMLLGVGHPHPDKMHVRKSYRTFILDNKRKCGTFKGHMKRREMIETYLWTKWGRAPLQTEGE